MSLAESNSATTSIFLSIAVIGSFVLMAILCSCCRKKGKKSKITSPLHKDEEIEAPQASINYDARSKSERSMKAVKSGPRLQKMETVVIPNLASTARPTEKKEIAVVQALVGILNEASHEDAVQARSLQRKAVLTGTSTAPAIELQSQRWIASAKKSTVGPKSVVASQSIVTAKSIVRPKLMAQETMALADSRVFGPQRAGAKASTTAHETMAMADSNVFGPQRAAPTTTAFATARETMAMADSNVFGPQRAPPKTTALSTARETMAMADSNVFGPQRSTPKASTTAQETMTMADSNVFGPKRASMRVGPRETMALADSKVFDEARTANNATGSPQQKSTPKLAPMDTLFAADSKVFDKETPATTDAPPKRKQDGSMLL